VLLVRGPGGRQAIIAVVVVAAGAMFRFGRTGEEMGVVVRNCRWW